MAAIIILLIIIIVPACVIANNKRNELLSDGKILDRRPDFVKKAEIFTINRMENYSKIIDGVMAFDYSDIKCSLDGDKAKQTYRFKGADWNAHLWLVKTTDSNFIYRFEFGEWSERNGIPYSGIPMNKLLTAIEKMFVSIDPNTTVSSEIIEYKTKHSFL